MKTKLVYERPLLELTEFQVESGIAQSEILSGNGGANDALTEKEVGWD